MISVPASPLATNSSTSTGDSARSRLAAAVKSKPDQYFVPPYVGHRGWLGVRLDRKPDWAEVEEVVVDVYLTVAPKRLADQLPDRLDI